MRSNILKTYTTLVPFSFFIMFCAMYSFGSGDELMPRAKKMLNAKTVQCDFNFIYYKDRSARSIAEEIAANGYEGVYYFVCADNFIRKDIIVELQKKNISVAMMLIASGAYFPAELRPPDWEKWAMKFTSNSVFAEEYKFMSFAHKDYTVWMKNRVVKLIKEFGFDGFTFAEAMYPIYDGLERKEVFYGDISPAFQEIFKKETGNSVFPDFTDKNSPDYYKKIPDVYNDLIDFRVKTINDLYDEVVNGKNGVRQECPGTFVATWTMGVNIPDGVKKLREWEGNDIQSMIRQVKPDLHFIQTHYPDWMKPELKPDYAGLYKSFFDEVKKADKNMPIGFQGDFVSNIANRRAPEWQKLFYESCGRLGINTTTYYVFELRWAIYQKEPELITASRISDNSLELCFDHRLSPASADIVKSGKIISDDNGKKYKIKTAEVDGSLLKIILDSEMKAKKISLRLDGICDDPEYRYFRGGNQPLPKGDVNTIPKDTVKTITLE